MTTRFVDSMDRLIAQARGKLQGSVEVNQIYAHYQHAHPEFHHPDGGEAFYLTTPLFVRSADYCRMIAGKTITRDGFNAAEGLQDAVEALSREVYDRAPWEFADLRASGHPTVLRDGYTVYDRPPMVHRLDATELRDKAHLRYLFDPHRYAYDRSR